MPKIQKIPPPLHKINRPVKQHSRLRCPLHIVKPHPRLAKFQHRSEPRRHSDPHWQYDGTVDGFGGLLPNAQWTRFGVSSYFTVIGRPKTSQHYKGSKIEKGRRPKQRKKDLRRFPPLRLRLPPVRIHKTLKNRHQRSPRRMGRSLPRIPHQTLGRTAPNQLIIKNVCPRPLKFIT